MIYIASTSALEFWLDGSKRFNPQNSLVKTNYEEELATHVVEFDSLFSLPVNIFDSKGRKKRSSSKVRYRTLPAFLPRNSFVRINRTYSVACPELCFLQASCSFTLPQLVELGNMLCSSFVFDENSLYGQRSRSQITSVLKIKKYINSAAGMTGVKKATAAIKYVQDNCGSPMECKIAAMLFLPFCRGGYGIPRGRCNEEILMSEKARKYYRAKSCRGDIVWEKEKVVFEYDGTTAHSNDDQRQFDARRQTVMTDSGYSVIRFTSDTIRNYNTFESAVLLIRRNLKLHSRNMELKKYRVLRQNTFIDFFRKPAVFFSSANQTD